MHDFQNALSDADAALKIEPSQEAQSLRGDAFLALKEFDKAITCYEESRRIDAAVAEAYYRKAKIQQASGQEDAAKETLERAVALDPDVEDRLR
jgi:tetratricopeptide (TPR) repeat protein